MAIQPTICTTCGSTQTPKKHTPGSIVIELILWCCFFVPGLIYSCWRISRRRYACRDCGSYGLIPIHTPRGKALANELATAPRPGA
jgi:hypothetical protein